VRALANAIISRSTARARAREAPVYPRSMARRRAVARARVTRELARVYSRGRHVCRHRETARRRARDVRAGALERAASRRRYVRASTSRREGDDARAREGGGGRGRAVWAPFARNVRGGNVSVESRARVTRWLVARARSVVGDGRASMGRVTLKPDLGVAGRARAARGGARWCGEALARGVDAMRME